MMWMFLPPPRKACELPRTFQIGNMLSLGASAEFGHELTFHKQPSIVSGPDTGQKYFPDLYARNFFSV